MKKSGNVTIRLGPSEVRAILQGDKPLGYYRRSGAPSIEKKVYEAVASKFTDVEKEMAEEIRARNICYATRDTEVWKEKAKVFAERKALLDEQYRSLNREQNQAMQELVQASFNEAGITSFVARGYGYTRSVK